MAPPTVESEVVVEVAEVIDVSLGITNSGVIVTSAGLTIPLVHTGILNVGWRTGVSWAKESAQSTPNTLYVIYEDGSGKTRQDIYDIRQPFRITFQENEWTRAIERLPNGAIVVAVEVLGGGETVSGSETTSNSSNNACPGAKPQRVEVGDTAKVCTKSDNLIVRDKPKASGSETFRIPPGTRISIINGPTCANNSSWWKVEVPAGIQVRKGAYDAPTYRLSSDTIGWVREGSDEIDPYFICPVP
jgi:hypothetical protein